MLLKTGQVIIDRLKQKCPSADGKIFSASDLAGVAETAQAAPALHVVLQGYDPAEVSPTTGAIRWQETWCIVAVVKHAARQDRSLSFFAAAAPMLLEVATALSKYRYPLSDKVWGMLEVTDPPRPYIGDVYAYFPISFKAVVTTPGADGRGA